MAKDLDDDMWDRMRAWALGKKYHSRGCPAKTLMAGKPRPDAWQWREHRVPRTPLGVAATDTDRGKPHSQETRR